MKSHLLPQIKPDNPQCGRALAPHLATRVLPQCATLGLALGETEGFNATTGPLPKLPHPTGCL